MRQNFNTNRLSNFSFFRSGEFEICYFSKVVQVVNVKNFKVFTLGLCMALGMALLLSPKLWSTP